MPGLLFSNGWMLAGLVALSVPILIHLLLRRKKKRLRFSTVQFFLKQDEQSSQRRKLRNWLLLALRLLICTLLVLAFARPYLQKAGAAAGSPVKRQVVVVLDRSLSMQATMGGAPKWERAKEAVRRILVELRGDDRAALIGCAGRAEVLSEWAPAPAVTKLLADLQPTCAAANLAEGLQQARRLLSFRDPKATGILCVVSDLQRSSAQNLASHPVPQDAELKLVSIGDLVTPNLAITDLQIERTDASEPHALVTSFSDEASASVKVELSIDGKVTFSHTLALPAGASTNVDLAVPSMKPGWHDLAVHLRGRDALAQDDARYQSVFIPEPARVWVGETRQGKRSFEEETFFITTALDPAKDSTNAIQSRFSFEKLTPDDLAAKLLETTPRLPCDLVVLPGLKQVPAALGQALARYLQAGGGLLMFVGDEVSANRYNGEFRSLLPASLGNVESSARELGWRLGPYDTNLAIFAAFQLPNSGNLSLPRFTKRFALTLGDTAVAAAQFEDGVPFLVTSAVGPGRVVLVNTSADTSWNDWPKHKSFVPWLHGTGHYLAALKTKDEEQAQASLMAGSVTDIELGPAAAKATFKLRAPDGKEVPLVADAQGQLRDVTLAGPGVYSLQNGSGQEIRRMAVNVPVQESDLTALSAKDFQDQLARLQEPRQTTLAAGLFGSGSNQRELWRVLLLAALVLLLVEVLLANRTLA